MNLLAAGYTLGDSPKNLENAFARLDIGKRLEGQGKAIICLRNQ